MGEKPMIKESLDHNLITMEIFSPPKLLPKFDPYVRRVGNQPLTINLLEISLGIPEQGLPLLA